MSRRASRQSWLAFLGPAARCRLLRLEHGSLPGCRHEPGLRPSVRFCVHPVSARVPRVRCGVRYLVMIVLLARAIPRLCARVAGCMWSCRCGACLCVSSWARLCARVLVSMRVCLPYLRRCLCGREAVAVSHHAAADGRGLVCNSCSSKDALNALLARHVLEASTLRTSHSCSLFRTLNPGTLDLKSWHIGP